MKRNESVRKRKKWSKEQKYLLLLASPFILFLIIFSYIPLADWILAFMNFKPGIPLSRTPFVGLDNFKYQRREKLRKGEQYADKYHFTDRFVRADS